MKNRVVSFELSKLSFEKGYIRPVGIFSGNNYYNHNGVLNGDVSEQLKESFRLKKEKNISLEDADKLNPLKMYHAPKLHELQDWLREKHNIHVNMKLYSFMDKTYEYVITCEDAFINSSKFMDVTIIGDYYDVLEKGLKHGLKFIMKRKTPIPLG